jgi:hypothetical protein
MQLHPTYCDQCNGMPREVQWRMVRIFQARRARSEETMEAEPVSFPPNHLRAPPDFNHRFRKYIQ